jgi:CRISPR-associated protein Cmr6
MKSLKDQLARKADQLSALGIEITPPPQDDLWQTDPKRVPMMYRAQVKGRCSLHNASKGNQDLDAWTEQWIYPLN